MGSEAVQVVRIGYAKLFNLGNYENERIEAVADVEMGATAWNTLVDLKASVERWGSSLRDDRKAEREREGEIYRREGELARLQSEYSALVERVNLARAFLERTGIGVPAGWDDDIPF